MINLITLDVDAKGDFFTKKANFDYIGLNIDIFDAYIKLNNHDVEINNMKAKYKDMATAEVDVIFDAKTSKGIVTFDAEYIGLNKGTLLLDNKPLRIVYNISPNNDTISIEKSRWKYNDFILDLNSVTVPFDLDTLIVKLPATYYEIEGIASGFIAGTIPVDTLKLNLRTDILKFNYKGVKFSQSDTPLNIYYDDKITISSISNILFNIDGYEFDLNNAEIDIGTYSVKLNRANLLTTDGLLSSKVTAFYNTKNGSGIIGLQDLYIKDKTNKSLLYAKEKLVLSFASSSKSLDIHSKELEIKLTLKDKGWSAELDSLAKLADNSKILRNFKLTQGKLKLHKYDSEKSIRFNADIAYPYKLLVQNNIPVQDYKIKGKFNSKKAFININENINVKINHNIDIKMKNSGINMPGLLKLLNDFNSSSSKKESKNIIFHASDSYLYVGHDRRVISDRMELQHHKGITTAQLEYKDGSAGFKLHDNNIHLYGENFNDEFMKQLFSLAEFKSGKLSFSMNGALDNYDGLFYITDTTIVNYKLINNILAFINTVPSLATFSIPGYSKSGLKVKSAYMNFNAKNSVFEISDFFLDSKEIDILGGGMADLNKDKIDITLNLKTDLGSSISKIPLVGYILLGEDTISTTMKITGKLSNPDVKSLIAKDIVVAPINILTRTLLLPYDLLKSIKDLNSSE